MKAKSQNDSVIINWLMSPSGHISSVTRLGKVRAMKTKSECHQLTSLSSILLTVYTISTCIPFHAVSYHPIPKQTLPHPHSLASHISPSRIIRSNFHSQFDRWIQFLNEMSFFSLRIHSIVLILHGSQE